MGKMSRVSKKAKLIMKMMTIPNLMIINLQRIVVSLLGIHQIMVTKKACSKRIGGEGEEEIGIKEATTIEVGIIEGYITIEADMVIEEDSINKTMDIMDTVMVDMEVDGNEKEIYVIELFYCSIF